MDTTRPLSPTLGVRQARDAYLAENGFRAAAYDEPRTTATFFGLFDFAIPNTPHHRWALMRHDLHHVITGYGTDQLGEGEISVWELRRGLRGAGVYVGSIILSGALFGCLLSPRRMWRAWKRAGRGPSLIGLDASYDELLALDVGALRQRLSVPTDGVCDAPRRLHARAPASASADSCPSPRPPR
jgi:hypothetical protein